MEYDGYTLCTPTEVMLRNRIAELEGKLRVYERVNDPMRSTPTDIRVGSLPRVLTLVPKAELAANINRFGILTVRVKGHAEGGVVYADYSEQCWKLSPAQAANMAAELHRSLLHTLADAVEKGGFSGDEG